MGVRDWIGLVSPALAARITSRQVMVPNGKTKRSFSGKIVGVFQRVGPNSWDDYQLVAKDGGPIEVLPGVRIQIEPEGTLFRMRTRGQVMLVAWVPEADEGTNPDEAEARTVFLDRYVDAFANAPGQGAAAFIARQLRR